MLLSFPDSLSGLFPALIGSLSFFSPLSPLNYIFSSAFFYILSLALTGRLGEVVDGATTVWENWDGKSGSHNHYSPGAVCRWLFDTVCGIRPMGERRFMIAPIPGGTLKAASAEYRSLYGMVSSGWKRRGGKTAYSVYIPPNCTALLRLPDGTEHELTAGQYTF